MTDDLIQEYERDKIIKLKNIPEIIFPQDTTFHIINDYACRYCIVKKLDLHLTQITSINLCAFANCDYLSEVIFPESLVSIGQNAFLETTLKKIHIPKNVIDIGDSAFNQIQTIEEFTVDANNNKYSTEKGSLYNKDKTILYRATNNITSYLDIPNFNNLECVAGFALTYVPITSFIASKSLLQIKPYTFHVVPELKTIDLTYSQVTELPYYTINSANVLSILRCPLSLQCIKNRAFYVSTLQTIVIFSGLNILESESFINCSKLNNIIYYGVDNFSSINIARGSTNIANIHVYTTKFYQYKTFCLIEVEPILFFHSCKCKNNKIIIFKLICIILLYK